ncbi:MAG: glycoside hydrolase family 9 protein [Prevotella sp.]|nr:glycoside hydrolase family 9 protein [Prevotella sp.]
MKKILTLLLSLSCVASYGQSALKVNQVGYHAEGQKVAVAEPEVKSKTFTLKDSKGRTVWKGKAVRTAVSPFSDKTRQVIDFSKVSKPGTYTLSAGKHKQQVIIAEKPYGDIAVAAMKSYYLQRTGMPIEEKYAGKYARPAAHPDTNVQIHPSAASPQRPAGTVIESPYGWYDAGDYNKYIVNSGFTVSTMLMAYQINKENLDKMNLNIPESGNNIPDFLDEIMYNLKWMLTMQDPADGGVYHKLTTPNFEGFIMPKDCKQQRYVVQKSTQAALDFAATMALAARIYNAYSEYGEFCKEATAAAERAYAWAVKNPGVMYDQPGNNEKYDPDVATGMYDDKNAEDEFFWAATELYLTTKQTAYLAQAKAFSPKKFMLPSWGNISGLGAMQWLNQVILGTEEAKDICTNCMKKSLKAQCDKWIEEMNGSSFHSVTGNHAEDFIWASNSEMGAGRGIMLMYQYALTKDSKYRDAAMTALDYIFGRNATGYCFVTGFGTQRVMHPHQRLSSADGITDPLPGFLIGGPNRGQQDKEHVPPYPSSIPDESYMDHEGSYASNEVAINWNAYLVNLLSWF